MEGQREEIGHAERFEAQAMPGAEAYGEIGNASPSRRRGARAAAAAGERSGTTARGARPLDLRADLRDFITAQGGEWGHDEWTALLGRLGERGHDVTDPDAIGNTLEGERIAMALGAVPGVGPRRVAALITRFGNLWSLRQASIDDLATVPGVPRALAERISAALH
jgi:hypothetical protein